MRKYYPYLQDPYLQNLNIESEKYSFLDHISDFVNQRQYVKMTLLTWEEDPIKSIEGEISSGSISKDGNSAIRRTCSLTCAVDGNSYNVENMDMDFTLNRKIFIEIGIKNDSEYYPEYPILWFPQGVFFITSFSMNSSSSSNVNLSLGLKDKMAMLNGDVGGMLPGVVRFDAMDTQTSDGVWVEQKVLVYNIISELVNHYGGEDLNNIVIDDVPLRLRKIMKWVGDTPLYGKTISQEGDISGPETWIFSLDESEVEPSPNSAEIKYKFDYGADVGYIYSDFIIQDELYSNSGDSVCTILDKIKTILGNYEYFYDEMGIFHFREIKNFLNVTQAEFVLDEMTENDYLVETTNSKSLYSFKDDKNVTSITVTPNYSNIKNEYIIHGITAGTADTVASNIMYHLVIDEKPQLIENDLNHLDPYYGVFENVAYYTDHLDGLNKLTKWVDISELSPSGLPQVGNFNLFYYDPSDKSLYYWDNTLYKKATIITGYAADGTPIETDPIFYDEYYAKDWRTFFYLKGLEAQVNGTDEGIYFQELAAFWPAEYDLKHENQGFFGVQSGKFGEESYLTLTEGKYFLDFIDTTSELGKYSVSAIGRRGNIVTDDKINCLFEPEIPNVIFLNIDNPEDNVSENTTLKDDKGEELSPVKLLEEAKKEANINSHPWTQVHEDVYNNLAVGGYKNSAYERIKYELFYHTNYQRTISLTAIPVFYLEPNSRVTISDRSTNTYGNFMVQSINIGFGPGANMSVTLNEVFERL